MKMVGKGRRQDANTSERLQQKARAQDYNRNLAKAADEVVFGRAFFQEIDD
jgi:alkanesulfonate monooxygenase SsuD/methylene tetrahydromethanopterin reductase-like flavin-dependent oxidoreductase (luciferase family)